MTKSKAELREDYERLVGAVVLGLNELELMLAYLMIAFYGDWELGNATAGPLGFQEKVKILKALNLAGPLDDEKKESLDTQLNTANSLAAKRNRIAHAELFSIDIEDDDGNQHEIHQLQKYIRSKDGKHRVGSLPISTDDLRRLVLETRALTEAIWKNVRDLETPVFFGDSDREPEAIAPNGVQIIAHRLED